MLGIDTGGTYTDGVLLEYASRRVLASFKTLTTKRDFAIGIELEGCDDDSFDERQYQQLSKLVIALRKQYPALSEQSICGHSDIAPGRKTDPGPCFDWHRLAQLTNNS